MLAINSVTATSGSPRARPLRADTAETRGFARWAQSNLVAALVSMVAIFSAFMSTWFLLSPGVETTDRNILIGVVIGNIAVAGVLFLLVGSRILQVWSERRNQLAGSRMHMQLVWLFSAVAVVPAIIAFLFAFSILQTSLNDVFSKRIDTYLNTAREIANGLVETVVFDFRNDLANAASDIARNEQANIGFDRTPVSFREYLGLQLKAREFSALYLLDGNRTVIARLVADDQGEATFGLPEKTVFDQLDARAAALDGDAAAQINPAISSFNANDQRKLDFWRGIIKLPVYDGGYLVAYKPILPAVSQRLRTVRAASADWEEAVQGRRRVERVFVAGYIILALTILFAAIWAALSAATRIVNPVSRLVGMADRVSAGDLSARVALKKHDGEIGALSQSMNNMASQLQTQRNDLIETNKRFDRRRRFTEAVLSGVSAGVLGVGADGRVTIANSSAGDLFDRSSNRLIGEPLLDIAPELAPLFSRAQAAPDDAVLGGAAPSPEVGGQVDFTRDGRNATLNVRIVRDDTGGEGSFVVTLDDITQLISAQRNAAWGDVARRIAHEIKNPLTPIQLSAERLQRKYQGEVTSNPEVFAKCTDTIIRQVNDIGRMVDAFSSFARMPAPEIAQEDVRELARSALFPQRVSFPEIEFSTSFPEDPVMVSCDGRLIVQALTNLVKNAAESVTARIARAGESEAETAITPGRILVRVDTSAPVKRVKNADGMTLTLIALDIIDNGIGLPKADRHRLVEPYMTTRDKGTGLGLAIVKKVVEDHGGTMSFADDTTLGDRGGARITLTLPLAEGAASAQRAPHKGDMGTAGKTTIQAAE
ncbi:MAG: PAS domain-containing sensor histidine kinase [Pseudomonadota bacterium]